MKYVHKVVAALSASLFFAHASNAANWTGSATCDVTVMGPGGYSDTQTHKWVMTGAAPKKSGAFDFYPATWSVTGSGSLERTQGSQTLRAEWKRSVAGLSAPISVFVRASDGAVVIGSGHAQLHAANGVAGTQEVRVDGKTTSHAPIGLEAFEYAFPSGQGDAKSTHISGQKSDSPAGSFGPMQPAGSKTAVKCSWDFQQAGQAAAPVLSSAASGATTVQPGGAPPGITPVGSSTPTPAPTGGSNDQAIQVPGTGGNYRTPAEVPPPASPPPANGAPPVDSSGSTQPTDCSQLLADIAAQYQAMQASIELEYARQIQQLDAERTQLNAQIAALLDTKRAPSNSYVQAQIKALQDQLTQLDAEHARLEEDKRKALVEAQKEKERALREAGKQCE